MLNGARARKRNSLERAYFNNRGPSYKTALRTPTHLQVVDQRFKPVLNLCNFLFRRQCRPCNLSFLGRVTVEVFTNKREICEDHGQQFSYFEQFIM